MMNPLVSIMGIGCWQIGGAHEINGVQNGWQPISTNDRIKLIERAIELGFTFFDTASSYGDGESEEILGLGIHNSGSKEKVQICTKISSKQLDANGGPNWLSFEKTLQQSISRLKVEKIDTLLFHNPSKDLICERYKDLFELAKLKSLVDSYGISLHFVDDYRKASEIKFGNKFQWNFSILEKRALNFFENNKTNKKLTFIARSLLYRGLLTDRFLEEGVEVKFNDERSKLPKDLVTWVYKNGLKIQKLAEELGLTLSELAILYGVMNPVTSIGLIGVRTLENLDSLEKLICMSNTKIESCYEVARNYVPFSLD